MHREYRFLKELPPSQHFNVTVEVNHGSKQQAIVGFGGAFTDAAGINIAKLPVNLQKQLITDYYGNNGIEYRLGRIPIGGSDFSTRAYSYDDHAEGDESFSKFALQPEDKHYKLPYLKMASEVSSHPVKLFGSTWSPPAWMKTNGELNHGGFLKGEIGGKYYQLFAKYLIRFVDEYKKQNVSMWGLTIENEPQMGYRSDYRFNSLGFNSTMEREFVKHNLGPELERTGHKDIKVMIYDDNIVTSQGNIEEFANTVLSDKDANKYVAGVAYHWYAQHADKKMLDRIAKKYTNKFLLSTEACEEWHGKKNHVMLGHWATFDRYADDIIKDLQHSSSGFVDWNLVLDLHGGPNWVSNFVDAPIIVNATAGEYYRQPFFYALGHFSKFLVPNSVRLENDGTSDAGDSVQVVIFQRPDKSTVLTVLNKNNHPIMLKLHDPLQGFLVTDVMANSLESLIWY